MSKFLVFFDSIRIMPQNSKIKPLLKSPALTIFLILIVSIAFVWTENHELFSPKSILVSSVFIIILALCLFFISLRLERYLHQRPYFKNWSIPIFTFLTIFFLWYFLDLTLTTLIQSEFIKFAVLIILWLTFTYAARKVSFLPINTFFIVWIILIFITGIWITIQSHLYEVPYSQPPLKNFNISLKKKPNIYLYFLESYTGLDHMEEVYGINTNEFKRTLNENGFIRYKNTYAERMGTITSMTKLYTFGHFSPGPNHILGGDENNIVFKILKNNGYETGVHYANYPTFYFYMKRQGKYCDFSNLNSPLNLFDPIFSIGHNRAFVNYLTKIIPYRTFLRIRLNATNQMIDLCFLR